MTEDRILISHARDLKRKCADDSMITNTSFLDLHQRSLLSSLEKENNEFVKTCYYGGFTEAERVCCVFVPNFFELKNDLTAFFKENEIDNPLALIRIEKDKFSSLSHRDYLGSLMGLGIKREMLGDIMVDENGCFVFCIVSAASYICKNLSSVGRGTVKASVVSFSALESKNEAFELIGAFVASARLDNVVSAAFAVSRTRACEFIEKGVVFLNSVLTLKADARVNVGDKIVLRGKGKVIFNSVDGESKKGRVHITIKKYI